MTNEGKAKPPAREDDADAASRARNRTVMLTPDITGQVRARLQQETPESDFITPTTTGARPPRQELRTPDAPPPPAPRTAAPQPSAAQRTPLVGFLVSFDSGPGGEYFELRTGRLIITSEQAGQANHLVINDETVSPMHAILRIAASGEIQVLDQLSEHGTSIKRFGSGEEEKLCGDKSALEHGDVIRFGKRSFVLCVIHKPEE